MKTLDRSNLALIVSFLFSVIAVFSFFVSPILLQALRGLQWFFLLAVLWLVITPNKIPASSPASFSEVLINYKKILLCQITVIYAFYALTKGLNCWQPTFGVEQGLPLNFALSNITLIGGLFPWTAVALVAIAMQRASQRTNKLIHFMDCCPYWLQRFNQQQRLSKIINSSLQGGHQITVTLFAITSVLLFSAWMLNNNNLTIPNQNIIGSLILFVILGIILLRTDIKQKIKQITLNLTQTLLVFALILFLLALVIYFTGAMTSIEIIPANTSSGQWLLRNGWGSYWQVLQTLIWTCTVASLSPYIAQLCRNYTPRQLIASLVIFPMILSITALLPHHLNLTLQHGWQLIGLLPLAIVSMLLFIGYLYQIIQPKKRSLLMYCELSLPGTFKPRSIQKSIYFLILMVIISLIFIMQGGILLLLILLLMRGILLLIPLIIIACDIFNPQ